MMEEQKALVLFVCSSGGHLAQLVPLADLGPDVRTRWVTFPTADAVSQLAGHDVVSAHHPTTRHFPNLLRNLRLAWRMLRQDRPSVVVSSGAAVAVPFFLVGRLFGVPCIFIEVFDRIDSATLTGRLVQPLATRMLVQWPQQESLYRRAEVVGPLL